MSSIRKIPHDVHIAGGLQVNSDSVIKTKLGLGGIDDVESAILSKLDSDAEYQELSGNLKILGTLEVEGGIFGDTDIDLSNYYTKTEIETSGQSSIHWDNIKNVPVLGNWKFAIGSTVYDTVGGGETLTFKAGDNIQISRTGDKEIMVSSTLYTHPTSEGNKHIPAGGAPGNILQYSSPGTAVWKTNGTTSQYLRGDGTWATPPDTVYSHPTGYTSQPATALTGANVISQVTVNDEGHVVGVLTRSLTPSSIGAEPAFSKNTAFNKNFGTEAGTVTQGNDPRLSDARTPVLHGHSLHSDIDQSLLKSDIVEFAAIRTTNTAGTGYQLSGMNGTDIVYFVDKDGYAEFSSMKILGDLFVEGNLSYEDQTVVRGDYTMFGNLIFNAGADEGAAAGDREIRSISSSGATIQTRVNGGLNIISGNVSLANGATVDGVDVGSHIHDGTTGNGPKISYTNLTNTPTSASWTHNSLTGVNNWTTGTDNTTPYHITQAMGKKWEDHVNSVHAPSNAWVYNEATIKAVKVDNASNADTVGGFTVGTNVPADAKFDDTWRPIHTTPTSGATTTSIASSWAYTHVGSTGNGAHIPSAGTEGQFLAHDGSWKTPPDTVYSHPTGYTSQPATALTGANVISQVIVNDEGHVTGVSSRALTKGDLGLGSVNNYGIASKAQAQAGTSNAVYMTPLRTDEAIQALAPVKSVAGKTGTVTLVKGDVGLGNVENYGIASQADAVAGVVNTVYMTPLRVKEAIQHLSPIKSINGKTGVVTFTKEDFGLGNVPNVDTTDISNITSGVLAVSHGGTGATSLTGNKLLVGNGTNAVLAPSELTWNNTTKSLDINADLKVDKTFRSVGQATFEDNVALAGNDKLIHALTSNLTIRAGADSYLYLGNTNIRVSNSGLMEFRRPQGNPPFVVTSTTEVTNLNAGMVGGMRPNDIFVIAMQNTTGTGVISGGEVTATSGSGAASVHVSPGYIMTKSGRFALSNTGNISGFTMEIGRWNIVYALGKQSLINGQTRYPGEVLVQPGDSTGQIPVVPPEREPIILAAIKVSSTTAINSHDIYPLRDLVGLYHNLDTHSIEFFRKDNAGNNPDNWVRLSTIGAYTPKASVRIENNGNITSLGTVDAKLFSSGDVVVDLTEKVPQWNDAHNKRHTHYSLYVEYASSNFNISTKTVFLPSGRGYPSSYENIQVYKNGLRMFYEKDYTLGTNNSTVIFTNKHVITDEDLIVIDYTVNG